MFSYLLTFMFVVLWTYSTHIVAADHKKPNVLFIVCDDLNCDLGCYGHPLVKTPNIDKLAQRGTLFENAYCQYPLCGPSRASMLTGLYPDQSLVKTNPQYVRQTVPDVITLPQHFRHQGYVSVRIGKMFHYGVPSQIGSSGYDDSDSWDYAINPRGRDKDDEDQIYSVKPGEYGSYLSWLAAKGNDAEQTDGIASRTARDFLQRFQQNQQPFFLAVGLYRPHTPYVAPERYFEFYPLHSIKLATVPTNYFDTIPSIVLKKIMKKKEHFYITEEQARHAKQAYFASISFVDQQIGLMLNELERLNLESNTVVLFTSDHGYHLGEHGHWLKTTLFENATRVPLILAGPTIAQGKRSSAIAELIDLYPTLAQLINSTPPQWVSGISQLPVLENQADRVRQNAFTQMKNGYSLRTRRFRYNEWGNHGDQGCELYDHHSDPEEMHNLAENTDYSALKNQLSQQLHDLIVENALPPKGLTRYPVTKK